MARETFSAVDETDEDSNNLTALHIDRALLVLFSLLFVVSLGYTIYLAYKCTAITPTDVLVLQQRDKVYHEESFHPVWSDTMDAMDLYCSICNAYVQE